MTAPGPAPGVAYAGFWVRAGAYLIDALVLGTVGLLFLTTWSGIPIAWLGSRVDLGATFPQDFTTLSESQRSAYLTFTALYLAGILADWLASGAYFVLFWSRSGATPGMRALGLRVAREEDGRPIGIGRGIVRFIGFLTAWLTLGLGFLWVGIDGRKQGWHDKMAGTLVVRQA